jgi:16S rRNA (guanine(966)-N(2))-methyltransferase RsmD
MRVISGEFRSRALQSLEGLEVRPTPDRLRQRLFDVIAMEVESAVFLDAYAGTGAVGIEALSRGAQRAIFIEKNKNAVAVIEQNLASLKLASRARVIGGSAKIYIAAQKADIVFIDPPYEMEGEYRMALEALARNGTKLVIAQHDRRLHLEEDYGDLKRTREIRQGDNVLSFYRQP